MYTNRMIIDECVDDIISILYDGYDNISNVVELEVENLICDRLDSINDVRMEVVNKISIGRRKIKWI